MRLLFPLLALGLLLPACDKGGSGPPSGMIAMFEGVCPDGWSRYGAIDGRFPRGSAQAGQTGGGEEHAHGFDITARTSRDGEHQHTLAAGEPIEVDSGFFGHVGIHDGYLQAFEEAGREREKASRAKAGTDAQGAHDHLISVEGDSKTASALPPYLDLVFCKKD
jgi:hypothetical protein